jgi:hypothetical protein
MSSVEYELDDYADKAIEGGLLPEAKKIEQCIENKNWTSEEEAEFVDTRKYIHSQTAILEKLGNKDKPVYQQNINNSTEKLFKIENRRKSILGVTLEDHLGRKHSDLNIFYSFYIDEKCANKYFTEETFEYIEQLDLNNLIAEYNLIFEHFNGSNIKRIATQPYFLNKYFLSTGDPRIFFDKTVLELTVFQAELLSQGKMYKNILENDQDASTPPTNWYDNPDKLVNWYYGKAKMTSGLGTAKHADAGGDWVGGATQPNLDADEIKARQDAGEDVINLAEEVEKIAKEKEAKGGSFDIYDLLRIHNVDCGSVDPVEGERMRKEAEVLEKAKIETLEKEKAKIVEAVVGEEKGKREAETAKKQ